MIRLSQLEKAELYARDGYRCWLCRKFTKKKKMAPKRRRSLDHVLPKILNGPNTRDNLITCCRQCNMYRSAARVSLDPTFRATHLIRTARSESLKKCTYAFMEALTAYREYVFAAEVLGHRLDGFFGLEDQDLDLVELKSLTKGILNQINNLQRLFGSPGAHIDVIRSYLTRINNGGTKKLWDMSPTTMKEVI